MTETTTRQTLWVTCNFVIHDTPAARRVAGGLLQSTPTPPEHFSALKSLLNELKLSYLEVEPGRISLEGTATGTDLVPPATYARLREALGLLAGAIAPAGPGITPCLKWVDAYNEHFWRWAMIDDELIEQEGQMIYR
jgi:hypothetical protein